MCHLYGIHVSYLRGEKSHTGGLKVSRRLFGFSLRGFSFFVAAVPFEGDLTVQTVGYFFIKLISSFD